MLRIVIAALLWAIAFTFNAGAADRAIVVFDASGSMWGQIAGKTKIEIARETIAGVLPSIAADTELGLMVYGHREKGSCADIELAVAPAPGTAGAIADFVNRINPKGKTPLSSSVKQAAEALRYTEAKATVVLVTDGLETCEADPCALASELEKSGVDFTAHVVGFGLSDEEGKQVACLAENTGGKYLKADDAGQLADALKSTVVEASAPEPAPEPAKPEFNVVTDAKFSADGPSLGDDQRVRWDFYAVDASGERAANISAGEFGATSRFNLPAGRYAGIAKIGALSKEVEFDLAEGSEAKPVVVFDAGTIKLTPKFTPDGPETGERARVDVDFNGGTDGAFGTAELVVAAGPLTIRGQIGEARAELKTDIKAGETKETDLVIPAGVVVPTTFYAEGGSKVETDSLRIDILAGAKDIEGNRAGLAGGFGPNNELYVPAGNHVLVAKLGQASAEVPVTVKAGERTDATIVLNAGVLAISAPGANRIDILSASKDINGENKNLSGNFGETHEETLQPGEYLVKVEYQGDTPPKTANGTVKAGERTELTVQ